MHAGNALAVMHRAVFGMVMFMVSMMMVVVVVRVAMIVIAVMMVMVMVMVMDVRVSMSLGRRRLAVIDHCLRSAAAYRAHQITSMSLIFNSSPAVIWTR
ncbi:hypothetical protein D3C72_1663500 [compost metagenome]